MCYRRRGETLCRTVAGCGAACDIKSGLIASPSVGVIPCAVQREAVLCRHGILKGACVRNDPVSAQRHFMPQRARDDGRELFNRISV